MGPNKRIELVRLKCEQAVPPKVLPRKHGAVVRGCRKISRSSLDVLDVGGRLPTSLDGSPGRAQAGSAHLRAGPGVKAVAGAACRRSKVLRRA